MINRLIIIATVFLVYACTKEQNTRNFSNLLAGKLKMITDNTLGNDTIFLSYDSITGQLSNIKIRKSDVIIPDSIFTFYNIAIKHDNTNTISIYVSTSSIDTGTRVITYKIQTDNKQIIQINKINSDLTETLNRKVYINTSNKIDSVYDIGVGNMVYFSNINSKEFTFSSGNCIEYNIQWKQLYPTFPTPSYSTIYDTLKFSYSTIASSSMLYQQPLELWGNIPNGNTEYLFLLDLLQIDGYYTLPINNNLIERIIPAFGNTKSNYSYGFNSENKVSTVQMKTLLKTTGETIKETEQQYFYY